MPALWPSWRPEWIAYEDDELIAVDKPAGVSTQADESGADVAARVSAHLAEHGRPARLSLLHPLDSRMSGLVLLSKTPEVNRGLAAQLAEGVPRSHLALVARLPKAVAGFSVEALTQLDGRPRRTGPERLVRLRSRARSQPVRRALARAGSPAVGDADNGGTPAVELMVHHERMRVVHPRSGRTLELAAPDRRLAGWLGRDPERDPGELARRLAGAIERRYALGRRDDTDCFRLVHGAGDGLAGIELDRYGPYAVLFVHQESIAPERLLDALSSLGFAGVYLKLRPKKMSDADTRSAELAPPRALRGEDAPAPLIVRELGLSFGVFLGEGLATGIFLDQRQNRARVRALAEGRRVANLFGYTGAFSVAAAAAGASLTVTVDSSKAALERAAENFALNGCDPTRHAFVHDDAFSWLEQSARRGQRFELVILDPPSFSTTRKTTFRAARDYRALAAAALRCLAPGGSLLACTNHRGIVAGELRRALAQAARETGIEVKRMTLLDDPVDFPPAPGEPCHLKCLLLEAAP